MMVYLFHGGVPRAGARQADRLAGPLDALRENGGYGVQLFFILSGYLIATLLLREEARYGRIALRAFWIRRILRIWPLYYLIVADRVLRASRVWTGKLGVTGYRETLRVHLASVPGVPGQLVDDPGRVRLPDWLSVLWSVCVEEQFYLIVPLLIALVTPRDRRPLVVVLIAASIAVRGGVPIDSESQLLIVFNTFAQFDTLLSGVLLALVLGWDRDRPRLTAGCAGSSGRSTWRSAGS